VNGLPQGLADSLLQLGGLFLGERLVDVDDILLVDGVSEVIVAGEYLDVTVIGQRRVGLDHVFLNDRCTGHGVVEHCQVVADRFRSHGLAETLLQGLVGDVEADDDGPADVIPELLHRRVVDEVQVVAFYCDVGAADDVVHQLPLAEWDTTHVDHRVVSGDAPLLGDGVTGLLELDLSLGLRVTLVLVLGHLCGRFFGKLLLHCL
jgi:hypothetical protein